MSDNGAPVVPPGRARGIGAWLLVAAGLALAVIIGLRVGDDGIEPWWLAALLVVGLSDAIVGVAFLDRLEGRLAWSLLIGGIAAVTAVLLAISSPTVSPPLGQPLWDQLRASQSWAEPLALGILVALVPWELATRGRHPWFQAAWWTTAALVAATVLGEAFGVRTPGLDVVDIAGWLVAASAVAAAAMLVLTWWRGAGGERDRVAGWLAVGAVVACAAVVPERLGADVAGLPGSRVATALLLVAAIPLLVAGVVVQARRDEPVTMHGLAHDVIGWLVLSAAIVAVYAVAVAGVGRAIGGDGPTWLLVLTSVAVALSIEPARRRVRTTVDRHFWGARDDPLLLVRSIVDHVGSGADRDLLPTLAASLRRELRLDHVSIDLRTDDGWERAATDGSAAIRARTVELVQHGEVVGRLVVGWNDGPRLRRRDRRLLDELTAPLGLAVGWVRLASELRRSTQSVTAAREEERRRLRRDLHDGLGPALTGVSLGLRSAIAQLTPFDDATVAASRSLLARTADEVDATVGELKRIVRDLRPTAIDQLGLVGALDAFIRRFDADVEVRAEIELGCDALPAAIEVAIYRIVTEAVTNVVRHARASTCWLRIAVGAAIEIDVLDDGVGIRPGQDDGVGWTAMRERAAELGGSVSIAARQPRGTSVSVHVPLELRP